MADRYLMGIFKAKNFNIQYQVWGDTKNRPLLFFHGFPGSLVQGSALAPFLDKHELCVISCDRPGYGGTVGGGSYFDFLDGVKGLLEHLGVSKFMVIGVSGGAPAAHVMASRYAQDISSFGVICGLGTYNNETKEYFSGFQNKGLFFRRILPDKVMEFALNKIVKHFNFDSEKSLNRLLKLLDSVDQETMAQPENRDLIVDSIRGAWLQGTKGVVQDSGLFQRDWLMKDCDLHSLRKIPTYYFHGKQDNLLNYRMSEWMQKQNKNAQIKFFESEGHYSLPLRQTDAMLSDLRRISVN